MATFCSSVLVKSLDEEQRQFRPMGAGVHVVQNVVSIVERSLIVVRV